jgi:micrococcal nuclease
VYEYRCKVTRVVDGDTVDVDIDLGFGVWMHKERVRLYGIDTPESRTRDLDEKKYGLIAKEHIKAFMPVGSMQTLVTVKDKAGKYGRILGKFLIYDKKTDAQMTINDWMIREHHAVAYFGQSKDAIEEEHLVNRKLLGEIVDKNN